ncbi:MAG: hypothetical protein U5R49_24265 [Deltaproteobacteria bacterium]|nr:hypothetical protein [Deltaproteobacteria bacterium]
MPRVEARALIDCKERKKGELERRIRERTMESTIIGQVELVYDENDPDWAVVDGVVYRADELERLVGKGMRREDILAVHEIKRIFEGRVIGAVKMEGADR